MLELVQPYLPIVAVAGGVLVLVWGQRDRVVALFRRLRPAAPARSGLGPNDLFQRLHDLRSWCEAAGHAEAVRALDTSVLPAIVRGSASAVVEGGPKS